MPAPLILPISSNTDTSNFKKLDNFYDDNPPEEISGWDIDF